VTAQDGKDPIQVPGFSYLPRFITKDEGDELIELLAELHPIWERRHAGDDHARGGASGRRLTRPVYWLGAWQFACLGYYAEPDHVVDKAIRAEPFPEVTRRILERLAPEVEKHLAPGEPARPPTSALLNYYGGERRGERVVDLARLRPHQDAEPGPVIMFSVGQPALFEFVEPEDVRGPAALSVWLRHRSVVVFSGPRFKDHLYHRVVQVRRGREPEMRTTLEDFELRRVSLSFRHVPEDRIRDYAELGDDAREKVREYVEALAERSPFFASLS
jgi:alkylated DNA repair dioxygenase AlkB